MRIRSKLVMLVLALPMLTATAACGELQEAQQGVQNAQEGIDKAQKNLDTAQSCAKATGAVQFMPNFSDPQQAQEKARNKAAELGNLADQTSDRALQEALRDMQSSAERVASGEVTIDNSAEWTQQKLAHAQRVLDICSGNSGGSGGSGESGDSGGSEGGEGAEEAG
ncbi:ribosomal protein S20 [Actinopolyspora biskrensis]|uniref:Ribosomal protein S20 n=1 Tax=Actinopolyspora biskrensis TaxID=1470178 RepID=A0A852YWJ8_9ACTN|nr:hypothetical protein [Actinopolyspora biskrensis]NYH78448.1 ribosomal protein S20 [Actinopolyspora biskrensis]